MSDHITDVSKVFSGSLIVNTVAVNVYSINISRTKLIPRKWSIIISVIIGAAAKFAVTVTAPAGMVNVVVASLASAMVPPVAVHPLKTWPAGGVFAEIVTCVPAAKLPPPEPFTTVSAWSVGGAAFTVILKFCV